ncbi:hypothetical protein [Pelagicoccus albus]|uniref:DUF3592 domain-containing protein n=1 Tax=Pelagicoccus albus TaxID=415222 RepID=A0A7X1B7M4_9BACT|nr:hypothetical protein [Pelagicoccus albus]MBC2607066.1 hypothetical protein [Pelagicoccus albus]
MKDQGALYEGDPTIRQGQDGYWYHYPHLFWPKLAFLIASLALLGIGGLTIWPPLSRLAFGEREIARVVFIERIDPAKDPEIIRYRKSIPEAGYDTIFHYTVEIATPGQTPHRAELAIGSRRNAFANVNDSFEVIFFPGEKMVYQLYEHRTWAFGIAFLFIGGIFTACAVPTLLAVGKPIRIDPEAREEDS